MDKTQVAILDDHQLFRTGICELVNKSANFNILWSVGTPGELYTCLSRALPDLLLLDIRLKEASGLDVLRHVKASHEQVRVVMLTMYEENSYIHQMIENGADGYLLKDITPEELFRSLNNVMTLGKYYGTRVTEALINSLQHKDTIKASGISFTTVEIDVLKMLSEGLTAEEIAKTMFRSARTIEGYRQKLLDKTDSKNIAALISWAYKNGVLTSGHFA
jgi:DNA-binding NarL/FixJ family response regulator